MTRHELRLWLWLRRASEGGGYYHAKHGCVLSTAAATTPRCHRRCRNLADPSCSASSAHFPQVTGWNLTLLLLLREGVEEQEGQVYANTADCSWGWPLILRYSITHIHTHIHNDAAPLHSRCSYHHTYYSSSSDDNVSSPALNNTTHTHLTSTVHGKNLTQILGHFPAIDVHVISAAGAFDYYSADYLQMNQLNFFLNDTKCCTTSVIFLLAVAQWKFNNVKRVLLIAWKFHELLHVFLAATA